MIATPLNKFKVTGTRIDSLVGYGLTEIIIPTEITEIKEYAFQDTSHNSRIQRIIIPDSVTRIGAFSMRDCKSLEEVYLPSSVTRLEKGTFSNVGPPYKGNQRICHNLVLLVCLFVRRQYIDQAIAAVAIDAHV